VEACEHPRLAALPHRSVLGVEVAVASGRRSRLLGLAGIRRQRAGGGLLIPRCASVHSFGMRFELDLFFLDADEQPLLACRSLPPRRLAWCRGAVAVLEVPAEGGEFSPPAA
jgi:uncharacterized membrane protein (UPF0127 family)